MCANLRKFANKNERWCKMWIIKNEFLLWLRICLMILWMARSFKINGFYEVHYLIIPIRLSWMWIKLERCQHLNNSRRLQQWNGEKCVRFCYWYVKNKNGNDRSICDNDENIVHNLRNIKRCLCKWNAWK